MIIDAHAHCGIQDRSMPQSFEDYHSQIGGSGIEAVVMFSPVMEIYDRYRPNFQNQVCDLEYANLLNANMSSWYATALHNCR